jgi:type VI secretion system secreted protein Hcp
MAQDMFLKIDGINGESLDDKHKDEIEITSWGWRVSQDSNMHAGSGGGAGKATIDELVFDHFVDRAHPNLVKYCCTGKHIDQATLTVRKAGGNPLEYLKYKMSDVIVTSVQPSANNTDERIREQVKLSFAKFNVEYVVQNAQGGSGGTVTAGFDIKANKEV